MPDTLIYILSGFTFVGGITMMTLSSNLLFKKKKIKNNKNEKYKSKKELISINQQKLMETLNDSYKLENTLDGKERYYSLHYLLSHPELEFNKEIAINVFDVCSHQRRNLADYKIKPFEQGKMFNYKNSFEMTSILISSMKYKNLDEMKEDTNNFLIQFKELLNTNIEDLPRLEKGDFEIDLKKINHMYKYSFLGTKILIGVFHIREDGLDLIIIDEKEKVYIKKYEDMDYSNEEFNLAYQPNFVISQNGNMEIYNKEMYDLGDSYRLTITSLDNKPLDEKMLYIYHVDIEFNKFPFNTEGLLDYINSENKIKNDDFIFLKGKRIERNPDKNHWTNMIETNYRLSERDKKKFIKNLNNKLIEQKKLSDIEDYKEYIK